MIAGRQVTDESCLEGHSVTATWLSPNRWVDGSRYGTVRFGFDFLDLIRGRKLYWVEDVPERAVPACRLLVTANDVSHLPVRRYRPRTSEGPIRLIGGEWFWRDDIAIELMFEGDLPISRCCEIDIVQHHQRQCGRGSAWRCDDLRLEADDFAGRILAGALAQRFSLPAPALVKKKGGETDLVIRGLKGISDALDGHGRISGPVRRKEDVDQIVRAALLQISIGDAAGARGIITVIGSAKRLRSSITRILDRCVEPAGVTSSKAITSEVRRPTRRALPPPERRERQPVRCLRSA